MVQGLFVLDDQGYVYASWHSTLLGYAVLLLCVAMNTVGAKVLPKIEGAILILHILGFFAILIPLLHLAPRSTPAFVFTHSESLGGWPNSGLSWLVGLSGSIFAFIGMHRKFWAKLG